MATSDIKAGEVSTQDSTVSTARAGRLNELVVADGRGHFSEITQKQRTFSLVLTANTSTIPAGNIVGAAAAAGTAFALFNPIGSGVNLELARFRFATVSGTPAAGPGWHGMITTLPTAGTPGGTIRNNFINGRGSVATPWAIAAGSALTGATAPLQIMMMNFSQTATAAAEASTVSTEDLIDGQIVVPPGAGWVPLMAGAGTTWLAGFSITWAEVPV